MSIPTVDQLVLRNKSKLLLVQVEERLSRLDSSRFPSPTTQNAVNLLCETVRLLAGNCYKSSTPPGPLLMAANSLFSRLDEVERSSTERISWPLVAYCDGLWADLLDVQQAQVFYAVCTEPNYSILGFSNWLKEDIESVVSQSQRDALLSGPSIYLLQVASAEDENLPLYANIGHEFGHAYFDANEDNITKLVYPHFQALQKAHPSLFSKLSADEKATLKAILLAWAEELFCDALAARVMGPAFYFSFQELTLGTDAHSWSADIRPWGNKPSAHPASHTRLLYLIEWSRVEPLLAEIQKHIPGVTQALATTLLGSIADIKKDATPPSADVVGQNGELAENIEKTVDSMIGDLSKTFAEIVKEFHQYFDKCGLPKVEVSPASVAKLLERLHHKIIPNIVPSGSLLGTPATFTQILNTSALYRQCALASNQNDMVERVLFLERMTAKALESSLIQKEYNERTAHRGAQ